MRLDPRLALVWLILACGSLGASATATTVVGVAGGDGCADAAATSARGPRGSMTLADLQAGESFTQDGVTYENFKIKVLGTGMTRDLTRYDVVPGPCGFQIAGDAANASGGDGRLRITYDVTSTEEGGVVLTSVAVFSGENPDTMVKNKRRIFDDGKLVATMFAKPMPGMDSVQLELDNEGAVRVVDTIRVWGRFADGANVTSRYFVEDCLVPEPGTALLLTGGLLGLAAARRSGFARLV